MKILIVVASLSPKHGGPSKAPIEMAQALQKRGHSVDIFTTDQDFGGHRLDVPTNRPVRKDDVSIYYFRAEVLRVWPSVSYGFWRTVKEKVGYYDIVHTHSLWLFTGAVIGHYCRKHGVPYVISPCGAMDPFIFRRHRYRKALMELLFERRNFRHAAAINFATREEMELARLARDALPFNKGVIVPLGINIEDYSKTPPLVSFRRHYPEVWQKRIILFLSRINFKKGLDLLIPGFAMVARKRDDVHLVIAGPDDEGLGKEVQSWIDKEGLNESATLTGMLPDKIKLAVLHDAEAFILPSYSENFGVAVVEAMACRLPVIISNKVNIWREVQAAGAGLVTKCDSTDIASAIEVLLQDPVRAREMGENGRTLVANQYTWLRVAELLESVYQDLLAETKVRRRRSNVLNHVETSERP